MKISLITQDQELSVVCKEILGELLHCELTVCAASLAGLPSGYDLYICDFEPDEFGEVSAALEGQDLHKYLFLVHRDHLDAFRKHVNTCELTVLLKPVTRSALRAFVGQKSLQWREQHTEYGRRDCDLRAERDEMLQCLIEANLRLQEYDRERTNLLARAVHDFRAPLTALRGYCGLLLGEQLGSVTPDQREVLARMQRSANRLSRMANTMFQFSIAQATKTLDLKQGDIRECIEQALYEIAPYADEKRITVSVNVMPSPESLLFEPSQLEQVLVNLLDNACKFTPSAGLIAVRGYPFFWERRAGRVQSTKSADRRHAQVDAPNAFRVDVHDSGPGIPAAHIEGIFGEYTSYSGGCDRSGGGLGLAICKLIVEQHKGRIWAESVSTGATFSFVLPFRRAKTQMSSEGGSFGKVSAGGVS